MIEIHSYVSYLLVCLMYHEFYRYVAKMEPTNNGQSGMEKMKFEKKCLIFGWN